MDLQEIVELLVRLELAKHAEGSAKHYQLSLALESLSPQIAAEVEIAPVVEQETENEEGEE